MTFLQTFSGLLDFWTSFGLLDIWTFGHLDFASKKL
jgi:hypothetical protein